MLKYYVMLLALSASLAGVDTAQAVLYDQNIYLFHDGRSDPTTESNLWTLNTGSNPAVVSSGPGTETIGANSYDYWFTADNGAAASEILSYSDSITSSQALEPWTLRARVRSVNTTLTDQFIALYDGNNRWGTWIYDNKLESANLSRTLLTNTDMESDYRELELLYKPIAAGTTNPNDLLEVYLDQSFVTSFTRSSTYAVGTSPSITFGSNSSAGKGQANWNRIEFVQGATVGFAQEIVPAPEPSTFGLLALGGLVVVRRKLRLRAKAR